MTSLCTFNANNFFLRYRFQAAYEGDQSRHSAVPASELPGVGYLPGLPFGNYATGRYIIWDDWRRDVASYALAEPDGVLPDILCLQEVENIHAIRRLNESHFDSHYDYSLCIDGYDPRQIDVAVLSTLPITRVRSHLDPHDTSVFNSRDCLEVDLTLPDGETLTLFVAHLKSKFVRRRQNETDANYRNRVRESHQRRQNQAQAIFDLIDQRFDHQHTTALYAVVGDCNDTPESPYLAPLMNTSRLTNIVSEHRALDDRWTYYWRNRNRVSQIDHVLASRALAARIQQEVNTNPAHTPYIERGGLGFRRLNADGEVLPEMANLIHYEEDIATPANPNATPPTQVDFRFARYVDILDDWRNNASDHCPVTVWL